MIHGTLYERLLGRSVTHGCVRVGRDPLRTIVRQVKVGSQVFIY
jgi:lipoprotein-anchoring transpeptidase ErfK/SrfK